MRFIYIVAILLLLAGCKDKSLGDLTLEKAFSDKKVQLLIDEVINKNYERADQYLEAGVDINFVGEKGISPLLWVIGVGAGNKQVEYMLQSGANPNYVEPTSQVSAMYFAAGGNRKELLKLLLKYNGDPNIEAPKEKNLLMHAISQQRESYFKLLLDAGIDINWHDKHGNSAAWHALIPGRFDWAIYFVERGYDADIQSLAASAENRVASEKMQHYKEQLIDILKSKGARFPAGVRVLDYLKNHSVTNEEIQDLIYGRKLTLD